MEMDLEPQINVLVSNIIDEKHYSHCRLCLKCIEDNNFARYEDSVAFLYSASDDLRTLSNALYKIFGEEACHEIPGINAVCTCCLNKVLNTLKFIQEYEACTQKLNNIIDNLGTTLNIDMNISNKNQVMYIVCSEHESQVIFMQNNTESKKHSSKVSYKCFTCKEAFNNINELELHNKNMHDVHTCQKCMCTSKNEDDIMDHEISLDMFKCKECPQIRCTQDSLLQHIDNAHGVHVCTECGKPVKGLDKLQAHEERHHIKNECPKCGKSYTTKEFFNKHVKLCLEDRVDPHPMRSRQEKSYYCQVCSKGYSTPGGLRVHERFAHGNAMPHTCDQCGKKFTAPCYLRVHMVTHTKEKNFPCDICEGKFVSKEALLYHRRRHTGEKPYSCNICDEKFVNASARAEHIKFKHIGPTLSCELCPRKFVTKNFLRLHMKKHHDPTNKLYIGRTNIPPNVPGEQNMRVRITE